MHGVQARVDMKKRDGTPVAALSLLLSLVRSSQDYLFSVTTNVVKSLPAEIKDLKSLAASKDEEVAKRATQLSEAIAGWTSLDSKGCVHYHNNTKYCTTASIVPHLHP